MFKTAGIILTVLVGTGIGFRAALGLQTRYKKLVQHKLFIGEIADMVRVGLGLEYIFSTDRAKKLISCDGYKATVLGEGLRRDDIQILEEFYKELGMSDTEGVVSRCNAYREMVEKRVFDAEGEMNSKSRLYGILGIFAGLFFAVILI